MNQEGEVTPSAVDALLFDVGGVIVRIDFNRVFARWSALSGRFRTVFTSCTIGHRKPEPAAFDHVTGTVGVPAARILFFDDTLENVEGARACGLQAVHVTSDADVASAVVRLGL